MRSSRFSLERWNPASSCPPDKSQAITGSLWQSPDTPSAWNFRAVGIISSFCEHFYGGLHPPEIFDYRLNKSSLCVNMMVVPLVASPPGNCD